MDEQNNVELKPDSTDFSISKETSEDSISDTEKERIQCDLDSSKLALSHKKWIVGTLFFFSVVLYCIFIWAVFYVVLCKEFTPYTLIPISLVGFIPTAVGISILKGLYPHIKEQKDDDLLKATPVELGRFIAKNISPHQ